jgi:sulfate/thiosulfate-binding protein
MSAIRRRLRPAHRLAASIVAIAALATLSGCAMPAAAEGSVGQINIVGFSVAKTAYDQLGTAFAATEPGNGVRFFGSFGASGAQSRAVIAGQRADLVAFSLAPDMINLVKAGPVSSDWAAGPAKGIATQSVVVIAYRNGNPKGIHGWADLLKPGVKLVTADPGTSGSAKWNLLAAYAQALGPNNDQAAARSYLAGFVQHVVSWNDSGRSATDAFSHGTGDALISYENEAIAARASGLKLDYLVPRSTVLIQNPAAVTKSAPAVAGRFLQFLHSPAGEQILARNGFRPVTGSAAGPVPGANVPAEPFPAVPDLITVAGLGGWTALNARLFAPSTGLVPQLRKG